MSGGWFSCTLPMKHTRKESQDMTHRKIKLGIGTSDFVFSSILSFSSAKPLTLTTHTIKTIYNHHKFIFTNNFALGQGTDEGHTKHKMG